MERDDDAGRALAKRFLSGVAWTAGGIVATAIFGPIAVPLIIAAKAAANAGNTDDGGGSTSSDFGGF